jgi:transposase
MKRVKGTGIRSWELTEELWEAVKAFVLEHQWDETHSYKRKPGGGRKPIAPRRVLEGIFYVLRTSIQWKALPKEYGAASSISANGHRLDFSGNFQFNQSAAKRRR